MNIEALMYETVQVFLVPTLLAIAVLFVYAFAALGAFGMQWWQRRTAQPGDAAARGYPLVRWAQARARGQQGPSADDLDVQTHKLVELPRIATRVAPMLGLVATMIPMGPALKGLSDGNLAEVSNNLTVAFSAVILALIAASLTYWIVSVRRRWLAEELAWLSTQPATPPAAAEGAVA